MTIEAATIAVVPTSLAATGGTSTGLLQLYSTASVKKMLLDDSAAFDEQTLITFTTKLASASPGSPSGFTQNRRNIAVTVPFVNANGAVSFNTARNELSFSRETPSADVLELRMKLAQLTYITALSEFYYSGSLA